MPSRNYQHKHINKCAYEGDVSCVPPPRAVVQGHVEQRGVRRGALPLVATVTAVVAMCLLIVHIMADY